MRKIHPAVLFEIAIPTFSALLVAGAARGDLSYVDRSTGLQTPRMEGGRTEFEFGDVNGDGHVDLVSVGDHGSPYVNTQEHGVMVWFGDGTGQWNVFQNGDFGYGGCALGDVNNDGLIDIGYGVHHDYSSNDFGDQILEVALGDGTGRNWTPWDDGLATNGETWGMFGTDFADVDNDGDLDIGSISFGCCAGLHVYLNHADGTWTQSWGTLGGNSSMDFVFGDVNGDGNADFASSHDSATVYLGDGAGGFTPGDGNLPFGPWRRGVSLGDVNGDGRDDLAFRTSSGVQVWTWDSPGVWRTLTGTLGSIGPFNHTQIADMNLDGHGDVVVLMDNFVRIYAGDGAGGWALAASITSVAACDDAAFRAGVDADHNGFPDIVFVAEEACRKWTGGTNRPRFFAESSSPAEPFLHPASPRGGETWVAGSVRFIDWYAAVPAGEGQPTVSVEISTAGLDGPWTPIAQHVPDNGRYQWLLPANLPTTSDAHLRYTLHTSAPVSSITPRPFAILGAAGSTELTGFEIITGTLLEGTIDDLRQSDDSLVHTRSGFGETLIDLHHMEMIVNAVTTVDQAATMDITIESRIDEPDGSARIRLRNWKTNEFEQVAQYTIGLTEETDTIANIDATDYVNDSGAIDLSIMHVVFVPFLAFTFESFVDQVEVAVR